MAHEHLQENLYSDLKTTNYTEIEAEICIPLFHGTRKHNYVIYNQSHTVNRLQNK